ncbi:MAG TPA: hypothetical protein VK041_08625, partial [Opitutales bacterium]|nr:hypothetical protein [Opitutales bacterium]
PGGFFTSYSAPVVSAAVAMLLEEAGRKVEWANACNFPQAIKAILLAGAGKERFSEWERTETQPLDPVFGAGQLDIARSHQILVSGEYEPGQIVPGRGWHVGQLESGDSKEFHFSFETDRENFTAHLSWHRQLALDQPDFSRATVLFGEFELRLFAVSENGKSELQVSRDPVNNGQHLYLQDLSAGDYLLKISRVDGGDFEVFHALAWYAENNSNAVPTTFAKWQEHFFSAEELAQSAISGPEGDLDGDGIPNLLEYGLGGDPRIANRDMLPVPGIDIVDEREYLSLTFRRPADPIDLRYRIDASADLGEDWREDIGVLVRSEFQNDGTIIETWRDSEPTGDAGRFLRLTISIGAGR